MFGNLPPIQALMIKPLDVFRSLAGVYVHGADRIAAETLDFSRAAIRSNADSFQKALGAKSVGELVQAQGDQARENFNSSIGEMERIRGILFDLSRETAESVLQPSIRRAGERFDEAGPNRGPDSKHHRQFQRAA